ncbi:MAG: pyrroline-5-carboxylate reductase [Lachnospiraceae bacterium]|nr:pyrroline-5-carboxylate reductase [Lachnospiraceae bacterium]
MKLGVIGLGNMASAMIGGIVKAGVFAPSDITGSDAAPSQREKAADTLGIGTCEDNREVVKGCDYLILAIKPQIYETVLTQIKGAVGKDRVVISIAPGKTLEYLAGKLGSDTKIVRLMPNTPALVGEGCTGVCRNENVTDEEFDLVLKMLNGFGKAYEVKESQMDAVVAVSGSSPAYVFMLIDAMADGAVAEGLDRATAIEMAAQAVLGSAKMVLETGKHPGQLKDMVCSPAGTTIDAVAVLEEAGFRGSVIDAMSACAEKSRKI